MRSPVELRGTEAKSACEAWCQEAHLRGSICSGSVWSGWLADVA